MHSRITQDLSFKMATQNCPSTEDVSARMCELSLCVVLEKLSWSLQRKIKPWILGNTHLRAAVPNTLTKNTGKVRFSCRSTCHQNLITSIGFTITYFYQVTPMFVQKILSFYANRQTHAHGQTQIKQYLLQVNIDF